MKAIITIGIPGCGKSTWASSQQDFIEINLDNCHEKVSGDASNQQATEEAVKLQSLLISEASQKKQNIIISDCNIKEVHRFALEEKLKSLGYEICEVFFLTPLSECKKRNNNRQRIVPEFVLDKMQDNLDSLCINPNITILNNQEIPHETLINLIIFRFTKNVTKDLIDYNLIDSNNCLTESGEHLLQFCNKNYKLTNINLEVFIDGFKLINNQIPFDYFIEKSGLSKNILDKFDYENLDLWEVHDDYTKSYKLYKAIINNIPLIIP